MLSIILPFCIQAEDPVKNIWVKKLYYQCHCDYLLRYFISNITFLYPSWSLETLLKISEFRNCTISVTVITFYDVLSVILPFCIKLLETLFKILELTNYTISVTVKVITDCMLRLSWIDVKCGLYANGYQTHIWVVWVIIFIFYKSLDWRCRPWTTFHIFIIHTRARRGT